MKKNSKDKKLVHGCICIEGNEPSKQIAFGVLKPNTFPIYQPDDANNKKESWRTVGELDQIQTSAEVNYIH